MFCKMLNYLIYFYKTNIQCALIFFDFYLKNWKISANCYWILNFFIENISSLYSSSQFFPITLSLLKIKQASKE